MSLNEIVNCPSQFISSNPYLVVQHLDWIQCRYLLVQVSQNTTIPTSNVFRAAGAVPTR
jgi:ubiquitin-conjugating enzyme E2 Q